MTRGLLSEFLAKRRTTHFYSFSKIFFKIKSYMLGWGSVSSILQTVGGGGVGLLWNWVEEEIFSSWKFSLQQHCRVSFELSPTLRVHQHRLPCVVSEYVENINVGVNWRSKWKNMSKRVRVFQKGRQIATNPISSKTEMHFKPAASISNLTYSIKCIQLDQTKQIQDTSFSHLMQNNMIYSSHFESLTVCAKKVIEWIGMWLVSGLEPFSPIGANRYLLISLISHQNLQHF